MSNPESVKSASIAPWLFWIICGVICLILLILPWIFEPSKEGFGKKGEGVSAARLKMIADAEKRNLDSMMARAANGNAAAKTFNMELDEDRRALDEYIIPNNWAEPLNAHVSLYDQQINRIKEYLIARSDFVRDRALESKLQQDIGSIGIFPWFGYYSKRIGQVIMAVRDSGCIAQFNEYTLDDLLEDKDALKLRAAFGLEIKPSADDPLKYDKKFVATAATRLRLLEHVLTSIASSRGLVEANPFASQVVEAQVGPAIATLRRVQWNWPASVGNANPESVVPMHGQMEGMGVEHQFVITLRGPLAAVLAATAALERNHRQDRPICIIAGMDVQRVTDVSPGFYRDRSSEDVTADCRIAILEFTAKEKKQ